MVFGIFKKLTSLFSPQKVWSYHRLVVKLKMWQNANVLPSYLELPDKIYFNSYFWQQVKWLYSLTYKDKHEREVSLFWVDGDLVFSKEIRGEESRVFSRHNLKVRYEPSTTSGYFNKIVEINGNVVFKTSVYKDKLPKHIEIFRIMSMHTHPPTFREKDNGQARYSFFSATDINTLLTSNSILMGLITNVVYLIFKTSNVKIAQINSDLNVYLQNLLRLGFVIYKADFRTKMFEKCTYDPENF